MIKELKSLIVHYIRYVTYKLSDFDDDALFSRVPSPENDNSETTKKAIEEIIRLYPSQLLELANKLNLDIDWPSTKIRITTYCWHQSAFENSVKNYFEKSKNDNYTRSSLEECIKIMQKAGLKNSNDTVQFMYLMADIGIKYRRIWLSLG